MVFFLNVACGALMLLYYGKCSPVAQTQLHFMNSFGMRRKIGCFLHWYSTPETELYAKLSAEESAATYNWQLTILPIILPAYHLFPVYPGWVFLLQKCLVCSLIY